MIERNFILATAGHVDHGKSSLVKALTGTDPDRLPEEKARGITIDLGFAHLELTGKIGAEPATFHLGIVDVPGHEDFVKNMVAGVGSVDLALLIVAADDGWMPQTEEHLQILNYLGVTRGVVALTKIDLVPDEKKIEEEIRERLAESSLADARIVPTSVLTGRGLSELKSALALVLEETHEPRDISKPRLSVDRVFMLRGIGTVVTGTTTGGQFRRGTEIIIQPSGSRARIRSAQNHNRDVESSKPGTRTALNLPDIKGPAVQRGEVITLPEFGVPVTHLDVLLEKSRRLLNIRSAGARPVKDGSRVRVHLGASNIPAHLVLLGNRTLEAGGRSLAHLRFEAPVFAFAGDRFIVRDWSEQTTLCGGVVLDPEPPAERIQSATRREFLEGRAAAPHDLKTLLLTHLRRARADSKTGLLLKSRFSVEEIQDAVQQLAADGIFIIAGSTVIDRSWWDTLRAAAMQCIDDHHRTHPNRAGVALSELKSDIEKDLPRPELFDLLLADLSRNNFTIANGTIKRATHQLTLPPALQGAGAKVRAALSAKPFDPPSRKDVAPDPATQQALRFLLETGEAVLLSEDVALLSDALQRAAEQITGLLRKQKSATASEFRQALGTSRRVIIPLLEHLDKQGLTHREGDRRVLS